MVERFFGKPHRVTFLPGAMAIQRKYWIIAKDYKTSCSPHNHVKFTSSGKIRVKSYTVAIVTPAWCLVGRHFMTSFVVTEFFFVGGGCLMRAGEFGGKPNVSIWEKLTAACWHEQVKIMMVSRWVSWSAVVTEAGKPWSLSPSLAG